MILQYICISLHSLIVLVLLHDRHKICLTYFTFFIILMFCMENLGWLIMYVAHVKMSLLLMDLIYLMYVLTGDGSCVNGKIYCTMHCLTGTFISNPYSRDTVTKRLSTRTAAASYMHTIFACCK